ncbi:hypothetical protein D9756_010270 [Leucocoprinus leucothites]|uniref:Uncharacterized protein n=1 Tax=Leucocoprinus leucothites TaxID=201217 RepID=A0A8H5FT51_9AGAR|nr:hypothetical protein D9756_010270 [Leucoagaricus leucothites]
MIGGFDRFRCGQLFLSKNALCYSTSEKPYVVLHKGNACAEESLLLDYIDQGPFFSMFHAMRWKHRVVFFSTLTAFITYAFQPLAGSIFQIRQVSQTDNNVPVTSTEYIALADDIFQLNAFLAGAGYVDAAALHGLGDPPFVFSNWTTAKFLFPDDRNINETLTVNTTAITTRTNCANPAGGTTRLERVNGTTDLFYLNSTSVDGCAPSNGTIRIDTTSTTQQYGVTDVTCPNNPETELRFRPVMFWFFHYLDPTNQTTAEARTVFCTPNLLPFSVTATAHLLDGKLDSCFKSGTFNQSNNVTGPPLNGKAFNGVIFDESPDPFIRARATAISSGVSGTIFRTASNQPQGLQAIFDLPNGMLDLTSRIYTQHLAVSAKAIYFKPGNSTINGQRSSLVPRLVIDSLPGHLLAILLLSIGIVGVFVRIINHRQRRNLILAAPPGSIASITALTARSGFGELLLPYDNALQLERKLEGIKFCLDKRTGAIVADDASEGVPGMGRDDAMLSLLGRQNERLSQHSTSSQVAYQTASRFGPWVYKNPYEQVPD